jgi:hypothetical protein
MTMRVLFADAVAATYKETHISYFLMSSTIHPLFGAPVT